MFFEQKSFWLPKDVERSEEYQDACGVRLDERVGSGVAAIADGVASSLFSGRSARLITQKIVEDPPYVHDADEWSEWLTERRAEWLEPIDENALAWHQKPKFKQGAHTTLLWIEMVVADQSEAGVGGAKQYTAHAIGDCCLFHVREDKVIRSFPLTTSAEFNNDPQVIGSVAAIGEAPPQLLSFESYCQADDMLVLCTDAVASWALAASEAGAPPRWRRYWGMSEEDWREEVIALRQDQQMRMDDATLLLLKIGDG